MKTSDKSLNFMTETKKNQQQQQQEQQHLLQLESGFIVTSFMEARLRQGVRRLRLLTDWLSSGHCQSEAAISSL